MAKSTVPLRLLPDVSGTFTDGDAVVYSAETQKFQPVDLATYIEENAPAPDLSPYALLDGTAPFTGPISVQGGAFLADDLTITSTGDNKPFLNLVNTGDGGKTFAGTPSNIATTSAWGSWLLTPDGKGGLFYFPDGVTFTLPGLPFIYTASNSTQYSVTINVGSDGTGTAAFTTVGGAAVSTDPL